MWLSLSEKLDIIYNFEITFQDRGVVKLHMENLLLYQTLIKPVSLFPVQFYDLQHVGKISLDDLFFNDYLQELCIQIDMS